MENKSLGNFAGALNAPASGYLGDISVVDTLVRGYVAALANAETPEAMVAEADRMALIFSGADPAFTPIKGWNSRDELGLYIAKNYGKVDPNAPLLEILKSLFLDGALRFLEAAKAHEKHGPEASEFQIDALVEELVAVLTATWEITYPPED